MLRIDLSYPERDAESEVLARYGGVVAPADAALDAGHARACAAREARAAAEQIHVAAALGTYVLDLAPASREHPRLALGLSTRGALALVKAARIVAGLRARDFVTPDDVKEVAPWIMAHRLVLTPEAALEGPSDVEIVRSLLRRPRCRAESACISPRALPTDHADGSVRDRRHLVERSCAGGSVARAGGPAAARPGARRFHGAPPAAAGTHRHGGTGFPRPAAAGRLHVHQRRRPCTALRVCARDTARLCGTRRGAARHHPGGCGAR